MAFVSICPECDNQVESVKVAKVGLDNSYLPGWHAISYSCKHCNAVLGLGIDPVVLREDLISEILSRQKR
jgi:hypothetical protein